MTFEIKKVGRLLATWWDVDVRRFYDNLRFARRSRAHYEDLSHSYVNIFVELWRALAYPVGHLLAVLPPILIFLGLLELLHV